MAETIPCNTRTIGENWDKKAVSAATPFTVCPGQRILFRTDLVSRWTTCPITHGVQSHPKDQPLLGILKLRLHFCVTKVEPAVCFLPEESGLLTNTAHKLNQKTRSTGDSDFKLLQTKWRNGYNAFLWEKGHTMILFTNKSAFSHSCLLDCSKTIMWTDQGEFGVQRAVSIIQKNTGIPNENILSDIPRHLSAIWKSASVFIVDRCTVCVVPINLLL